MKTTLQRWGNSQGIRIPKSMVEKLGLDLGSEVEVEVSSGHNHITVTPAKDVRPIRGRHRIEDLIAASSASAFDGGYDWGSPQGKEVW